MNTQCKILLDVCSSDVLDSDTKRENGEASSNSRYSSLPRYGLYNEQTKFFRLEEGQILIQKLYVKLTKHIICS